MRWFVLPLAIAAITLSGSSLVFAQVPTSGNIFFGYSYAHGEVAGQQPGMSGWDGSLEGKFIKWFGIVADISAHYGSAVNPQLCSIPCPNPSHRFTGSRYTVMFGPRLSLPISKYTPFLHLLIGAAHTSDSASLSDTSFSDAIGGGLDYRIIPALAARFQFDELQTRFYGGHQNHARLGLGLVVRF
jgi:hypothetical protein